MLPAKFPEYFAGRPLAALGPVFQPLAERFVDVRPGSNVQQPLIGLRILYHGSGSAFNRQDNRALTFAQALHKVRGIAAEAGQRMDVLGNVEHGTI
jgi:hypothetical protein